MPKSYQECLEIVQLEIASAYAICITTDSWTSVNNVSFVSVTAHFIDNGNMKSYLLDCFPFSERHTAVNITEYLKIKFQEWKIEQKIIAIVSDNAANIVAAIRDGGWRHIGCFAHSINLSVQACHRELATTLTKVKSIVEYFKRSSSALAKLKDIQKQMGLPELKLKQDVVTRWNSTFDMLQRFYKLKEAIISTLAILDTQHEQLSSHDWIIVEKTIDILEIFYDITNEISAENNVSLSKVIVLCKIMIRHVNKKLNEEGTSGPIEIRLLLNTLRQQLNDRFKNVENNALYAEATILDPRFKKYGFRDENMCKIAINNLKKKNI